MIPFLHRLIVDSVGERKLPRREFRRLIGTKFNLSKTAIKAFESDLCVMGWAKLANKKKEIILSKPF